MKNACEEWKDPLLEAVLTGAMAKGLEEHLGSCTICSSELDAARARKARLDALLPLVARGSGPSANFRVRVLAAAEAQEKLSRPWRAWTLAGVTAVVVAVMMIGVTLYRRTTETVPENELAAAEKLAKWRAPSDALLVTPGQEILRTVPRLGHSYLNIPAKTDEEE